MEIMTTKKQPINPEKGVKTLLLNCMKKIRWVIITILFVVVIFIATALYIQSIQTEEREFNGLFISTPQKEAAI